MSHGPGPIWDTSSSFSPHSGGAASPTSPLRREQQRQQPRPLRMGALGLQELERSVSAPQLPRTPAMMRPWPGQSLEAADRLMHSTAEQSSCIKLQMRHMVKDLSKMQERSASA